MKYFKPSVTILTIFFHLAFLVPLKAQITWTGSIDSIFDKAGNWTPAQIPTIDDDVIIPISFNFPVITTETAEVRSMQVFGDVKIKSSGKLTINEKMGSGQLGGNALVVDDNGTFIVEVNGLLCIKNASDTAFVMKGLATNDGTILIDSCGMGISDGGASFGSFQNRGTTIGSNLTQGGIQFDSMPFRNDYCSYLRCDAEIRITYQFNNASNGIVVLNSGDSLVLFDNFVSGRVHHTEDTSKIRIITENPLGNTYNIPGATYWTGCQDSAWENSDNWLYLEVPDSPDVVVLTGDIQDPEVHDSAIVGSLIIDDFGDLIIQSGGTLQILHDTTGPAITCRANGFLRIDGTIDINAHSGFGILNAGQITQNGNLNISTDSIGIENGPASGSINQNGIISISGSGIEKGIWTRGSSSITNQSCGIINIQSEHFIQDDANNFSNNGSVILNTTNPSTLKNNSGYIYRNQSGSITINTNSGSVFGPGSRMAIWTGCESESWHDPYNWSGAFVPRFRDSVIIDFSNTTVSVFSPTAKISHLSMSSKMTIRNNGVLNIGDPMADGLYNSSTLLIELNGQLSIDTVAFNALFNLNAGDSIINRGKIEIQEKNIVNNGVIINEGIIEQKNGKLNHITQGGFFFNDGMLDIAMNDAFSQLIFVNSGASFENSGFIKTRGGMTGINLGASNPKSSFINHPCAAIDVDKPIKLENGDFTNNGLINYDVTTFEINGSSTYTDDGYQFDPNGVLPDGGGTITLGGPMNYGFFTADIDHDGVNFCGGDEDDAQNINNLCTSSFPVICGREISGSNNLWNTVTSNNLPDCVINGESTYVGMVWYTLYGTGDSLEVSAAVEAAMNSDFVDLQVYEGTDTENDCALECIGGIYGVTLGDQIRFRSVLGKQYFLALGTYVTETISDPNMMDYSLSVQCLCEDRDILLDEVQDFGLGKDFLFTTDGEVEVLTDFPVNGNIEIDAAEGVLLSPVSTVSQGTLIEISTNGCVNTFRSPHGSATASQKRSGR